MANEQRLFNVKDLFSLKKAARYLGVTTMTLWRWRRNKIISVVMLDHPYFHIDELNRIKALREKKNKGA